ncbi:hypothetical protein IWQ61_009650, partial [Dispira simplex]
MDRSLVVDQEKGGIPRDPLSGLSTVASNQSGIPCSPSTRPAPVTTTSAKSSTLAKSQDPNRPVKTHVPSACANCKKAHLACD